MTPDRLRELVQQATPGPWRIDKNWNKEDNEPVLGIVAGKYTTHQNKGDFHPNASVYTDDELVVVHVSLDPNWSTWDAGVDNERDARLIALAPELATLLADAMEVIESEEASVDDEGWRGMQRHRDLLARFARLGAA